MVDKKGSGDQTSMDIWMNRLYFLLSRIHYQKKRNVFLVANFMFYLHRHIKNPLTSKKNEKLRARDEITLE